MNFFEFWRRFQNSKKFAAKKAKKYDLTNFLKIPLLFNMESGYPRPNEADSRNGLNTN